MSWYWFRGNNFSNCFDSALKKPTAMSIKRWRELRVQQRHDCYQETNIVNLMLLKKLASIRKLTIYPIKNFMFYCSKCLISIITFCYIWRSFGNFAFNYLESYRFWRNSKMFKTKASRFREGNPNMLFAFYIFSRFQDHLEVNLSFFLLMEEKRKFCRKYFLSDFTLERYLWKMKISFSFCYF